MPSAGSPDDMHFTLHMHEVFTKACEILRGICFASTGWAWFLQIVLCKTDLACTACMQRLRWQAEREQAETYLAKVMAGTCVLSQGIIGFGCLGMWCIR